MLSLFVVYVGIATIIAVTHKTVRIAHEDFQSAKMAGVAKMYCMETVVYEDVDDDGTGDGAKLTGDRDQMYWGYFEVHKLARIVAGMLWPLGIARMLVRFIFTDAHAPR